MLGIIGAMEQEVSQIVEAMNIEETYEKAGMVFNKGTLNGKPVVIVKSGVGKVNAAVCTQILCDHFNIDRVINTGIAGSLRAIINIGDVVISTDVLHHDMDVSGLGYPLGQIPDMEVFSFKADEYMANAAEKACSLSVPEIGVFRGRVVSGDQFVSGKEIKERITANFDACCTEMEGAAIAQTAYLNGIPFLILRTISDKADDSAHMDYPAFEAMAIKNSVAIIRKLVELL